VLLDVFDLLRITGKTQYVVDRLFFIRCELAETLVRATFFQAMICSLKRRGPETDFLPAPAAPLSASFSEGNQLSPQAHQR
jgi:hypothetical protein